MPRIAHIGIVVKSIQEALPAYTEGLGLHLERIEELPAQRVRVAFLPVENGELELLEPLDDTSGVAKFLSSRGEGIHHICLEVDDIRAGIARATESGAQMIDKEPRKGAEGEVAFIHPKSLHGVLVELLQGGPDDA